MKNWIIAKEVGKNGYEHWQIRMDVSGDYDDFFKWVKSHYPEVHMEKGSAGVYETAYERKEGRFVCNRDKLEALKCRYGVPNGIQKEFLRILDTQSVRQIDVWYDPSGCHGKSWFAVHMADTGKALYVPSSQSTPANLESFIVHNWTGEDFIIIDIPRAGKIPNDLYEVMERIKDGWLVSTKWQGKSANVRGTKLAVFTNTKLDTKKLSNDRWRLHGIHTEKNIERNRRGTRKPARGQTMYALLRLSRSMHSIPHTMGSNPV